jgi:hypothetical protein
MLAHGMCKKTGLHLYRVHAREARKVTDTLLERRGGRQSAVTAAPALSIIAESLPVRASHLVAQTVRESGLATNHLGYLVGGTNG